MKPTDPAPVPTAPATATATATASAAAALDSAALGVAMQPLARELSQLVHSAMAKTLREATATDSPRLRTPRSKSFAAAGTAAGHGAGTGACRAGPGVQALAALHPGDAAARQQAQALYARCLQHYKRHVQPQLEGGVQTQDDVGIAAAFFVLANLGACHGQQPDAAALPAVERQLRGLLAQTSAWRALGSAGQQSLFEQFALLGVLVNESRVAALQQGPEAQAHVRHAARGYLQQLLGLSPDRLSASVQGLSVLEHVH